MGEDKTTKCMKCDNIDCNRRLPVQNVTFDQLFCFSLQQLDTFAFDFLSANGDISDILNYVSPQRRPNIATMDREQIDKAGDYIERTNSLQPTYFTERS